MPHKNETFWSSTFPPAANDPARDSRRKADLRRVALAISASRGEDQLAVDILVNLAAYPGEGGRDAQQALRQLYEVPKSGDAQGDEQIRANLLRSARAICEFALLTAAEIHGGPIDLPLSLLVASMGQRSAMPEGGRDITAAVQAHVERRLSSAGRG